MASSPWPLPTNTSHPHIESDHSINFTLEASVDSSLQFFGAPPLWVYNFESEDIVTGLGTPGKKYAVTLSKNPRTDSLPILWHWLVMMLRQFMTASVMNWELLPRSRRNSANPTHDTPSGGCLPDYPGQATRDTWHVTVRDAWHLATTPPSDNTVTHQQQTLEQAQIAGTKWSFKTLYG